MSNGGRLVWSLPVVVVAGLLAVALNGTAPAAPVLAEVSDVDARVLLVQTWERARLGDAAAFCGADPWCRSDWAEYGGRAGVPSRLPRIVRSTAQRGHRWLRLCGTRGDGTPYETDFVVGAMDGEPEIMFPMFWGWRTFSGVYWSGEEPRTTGYEAETLCE